MTRKPGHKPDAAKPRGEAIRARPEDAERRPAAAPAAPGADGLRHSSGEWVGARLLLRRLRDVMAAPGGPQERLDKVVALIAGNMVAEVCSIYLLRAGDVLELFATHGLNPQAVHRTRLRVGEGIVGEIAAHARPVALADAQSHPSFAYRPETGEEQYHSMMGVPILRGGRVLGVLAVQNRTQRHYHDEEVEALQTIAMVCAELVAGGDFVSADELRQAYGNATLPLRLEGIRFNGGPAIGLAVPHRPKIAVRRLVAENIAEELDRLREAVQGMHDALDILLADSALGETGEHREILESYRMIAEDRGWLGRIREAIESGLTADAAVRKIQDETSARMVQITDPYLRERAADFDDLADRLLQHLAGEQAAEPQHVANDVQDMVVVAKAMGPAQLLDYDRRYLRALLLEDGSPTSHVAIVARALDIPVVGRVRGLLDRIEPYDQVIVDGDNAQIFVRPGEDVLQAFSRSMRATTRRRAAYAALRDLPAETRDGFGFSLHLNAGLLVDIKDLESTGAAGVGLYRTEIPFMVRSQFPDVRDQTDLYGRILDQAEGKPVVFRTLDVGGDKVLPYLREAEDGNPAMGWRAIRIALDRPSILRRQLRAMIEAAAGRELSVMFPMITEVAEFDSARAILDIELQRAEERNMDLPKTVKVGAMLEVPALIWQLPALLERVDFLSVGSNDLTQFMFASDRSNPRLAQRYDVLSPSVLALLGSVADQCGAAGIPVTVCGEMAGQPLEAMALAGVGYRSLSMAGPSVGPVKEMIRSLELRRLADYLGDLCGAADHSLRGKLKSFAMDHGVVL